MDPINRNIEALIEIEKVRHDICERCPGTLWGAKSICRVFQQHISEVEYCSEWNKDSSSEDRKEYLEPALEILQRVDEDLRDYHWMIKEVGRLESRLKLAGDAATSMYGIESTLPKPTGRNNDPVGKEAIRRVRQLDRLDQLRRKIKHIEQAVEKIQDEKERTVLECILDGERMGTIAHHVGLSRQKLNKIKREISKKMAWEMYRDEF
ncbi:DNA-binding XRE family transcriptional regulator [Croceifilum oryzae]|uniref:DNA-binding XRE family transcriptional regulator n=1 Tax=Croceifilum oryzae TaxID=1553429 RepID=A0AAJ1TKQ8_9BACL|nr:hypothetical protein [Croceifilum oryzae]MDQ0417904.1 DNA-binding XRE family transcriptional regulator [Croceifilum oryzae]